MKSNVVQLYPEAEELYVMIANSAEVIARNDHFSPMVAAVSDKAFKISCQLQTFPENKCEDTPLDIINNSATGKSFEAWRRLNNFYEP